MWVVVVSSQVKRGTREQVSIPEFGVRNKGQYSESIHRQHPDRSEAFPACRTAANGDTFKEVRIDSYLPFSSWRLCGDCFPEQEGSR